MGTGRQSYIDELEIGSLVAFKLYANDAKMYSGKITKLGNTKAEVCTKNGKRYFIEKKNIYWVNTNGRWPAFVMSAFRGVDLIPEKENEPVEPVTPEPEENAPESELEPSVAIVEDSEGQGVEDGETEAEWEETE